MKIEFSGLSRAMLITSHQGNMKILKYALFYNVLTNHIVQNVFDQFTLEVRTTYDNKS